MKQLIKFKKKEKGSLDCLVCKYTILRKYQNTLIFFIFFAW